MIALADAIISLKGRDDSAADGTRFNQGVAGPLTRPATRPRRVAFRLVRIPPESEAKIKTPPEWAANPIVKLAAVHIRTGCALRPTDSPTG